MEVILAKKAGFCFGVQKAIDMVYDEANSSNNNIYTYGPIIHNEEVVSDLESKGVKTINFDENELNDLSDCTVVIRSHGVGKNIYDSFKLIEYVEHNKKKENCYVFLDEVQEVSNWPDACKTLRLYNNSVFKLKNINFMLD